MGVQFMTYDRFFVDALSRLHEEGRYRGSPSWSASPGGDITILTTLATYVQPVTKDRYFAPVNLLQLLMFSSRYKV